MMIGYEFLLVEPNKSQVS